MAIGLRYGDRDEVAIKSLADTQRNLRSMMRLLELTIRAADKADQSFESFIATYGVGDLKSLGRRSDYFAHNLVIDERADGSFRFGFEVSLHGKWKTLVLSPQLGRLLKYLATGEPDADGLAGWRSDEDVLKFLKAQGSTTQHPKRFMNGLLYLLRELIDKESSRTLIQRNKKLGVRFAVVVAKVNQHAQAGGEA